LTILINLTNLTTLPAFVPTLEALPALAREAVLAVDFPPLIFIFYFSSILQNITPIQLNWRTFANPILMIWLRLNPAKKKRS